VVVEQVLVHQLTLLHHQEQIQYLVQPLQQVEVEVVIMMTLHQEMVEMVVQVVEVPEMDLVAQVILLQ